MAGCWLDICGARNCVVVGLCAAEGCCCRILCEGGCCWDDCEARKFVMLFLAVFMSGVVSSGVQGVNGGVESGLGGMSLRFPLKWCANIFLVRSAPEDAVGVSGMLCL